MQQPLIISEVAAICAVRHGVCLLMNIMLWNYCLEVRSLDSRQGASEMRTEFDFRKWPNIMHRPGICLQGLRKTTRVGMLDVLCVGIS